MVQITDGLNGIEPVQSLFSQRSEFLLLIVGNLFFC